MTLNPKQWKPMNQMSVKSPKGALRSQMPQLCHYNRPLTSLNVHEGFDDFIQRVAEDHLLMPIPEINKMDNILGIGPEDVKKVHQTIGQMNERIDRVNDRINHLNMNHGDQFMEKAVSLSGTVDYGLGPLHASFEL
jgi:hypothetical protein